jgi:hypothetical protein
MNRYSQLHEHGRPSAAASALAPLQQSHYENFMYISLSRRLSSKDYEQSEQSTAKQDTGSPAEDVMRR